jgi:hypothetical protein
MAGLAEGPSQTSWPSFAVGAQHLEMAGLAMRQLVAGAVIRSHRPVCHTRRLF